MAKPKPRTTLLDHLRSLISEARIALAHPNSTPAIKHEMLKRPFLKRIAHVKGLRMHLLANGLESEIRHYLKNEEDPAPGASPSQLALWPKHLRPYVQDINRARVFVPSMGEFVELVPARITPEQVEEAGDYLVDKGKETIRIGELLIELSDRYSTGII